MHTNERVALAKHCIPWRLSTGVVFLPALLLSAGCKPDASDPVTLWIELPATYRLADPNVEPIPLPEDAGEHVEFLAEVLRDALARSGQPNALVVRLMDSRYTPPGYPHEFLPVREAACLAGVTDIRLFAASREDPYSVSSPYDARVTAVWTPPTCRIPTVVNDSTIELTNREFLPSAPDPSFELFEEKKGNGAH